MIPHSFSHRSAVAGLAAVVLLAMAPSPWPNGRTAGAATQPALGRPEPQGADASLMAAFEAARARVEPITAPPPEAPDGRFRAANPWQRLSAYFADDSVRVLPDAAGAGPARWKASLASYGRGRSLRPVAAASPVATENRVEYVRGPVTEWYVNDARGLEQGFTLAEPPAGGEAGGEPLVLQIAVETDLEPTVSPRGDSIQYVGAGGVRLHYTGLKAWDARGAALAARMEVSEGQISLVVDDRGASYPVTVDPLIFVETKLTASDAAAGDFFGIAVAVSGDTAVVGAYRSDGAGTNSGAAYVFVRSGSAWVQQAKLTSPDAEDHDQFGTSVAIGGDTVVIGAREFPPCCIEYRKPGSAYVFVRSGSVWTQQAKLTASDGTAGAQFGTSVAIGGDTVVVGAPFQFDSDLGDFIGSAYVFVRSGSVWAQQAKLIVLDPSDPQALGNSVAISGDTAVVGALWDSEFGFTAGAAYVFVRSGSVWAQQTKLTALDAEMRDIFGASVAISGDTAVVGAEYGDTDTVSDTGAAYVFVRSGSIWAQQAKLTAPDAAFYDAFGGSVAISGDTVVVGAPDVDFATSDPGAAYVFVRSGSIWMLQAELTASDATADDGFGLVAVSGDTVMVGAFRVDDAGTDSGSAYIFLNVTEADVQVSMEADRTSVRPGDVLTYTITVRNLGPNGALNPVVVDELPSGATFVGASANRGELTAPHPGQTGTVTWSPGLLLEGEEVTAQIQVRVITRGLTSITNTATVSSGSFDADTDNNSASLATDVVRGRP